MYWNTIVLSRKTEVYYYEKQISCFFFKIEKLTIQNFFDGNFNLNLKWLTLKPCSGIHSHNVELATLVVALIYQPPRHQGHSWKLLRGSSPASERFFFHFYHYYNLSHSCVGITYVSKSLCHIRLWLLVEVIDQKIIDFKISTP